MAYAPHSFTWSTGMSPIVNLPFPVISTTHVKVYYDAVLQPNDNTIYRFNSASQIVLLAPPVSGALVKVARETPPDPLVTFVAGAVIPVQDLNVAMLQALYRVEELLIESATVTAYGDLVGVPSEFPPAPHFHDASAVFDEGIVPPDYLGTGTRNGTKFLRDDNVWADPPSAVGQWGTIIGNTADQADLVALLAGKANVIHSHIIGDVTGLQAALDAKLASAQAGNTGLVLLGATGASAARQALGIYVQDTDPGSVADGSVWIS